VIFAVISQGSFRRPSAPSPISQSVALEPVSNWIINHQMGICGSKSKAKTQTLPLAPEVPLPAKRYAKAPVLIPVALSSIQQRRHSLISSSSPAQSPTTCGPENDIMNEVGSAVSI